MSNNTIRQIEQWLKAQDSHSIYDSAKLAEEFNQVTGEVADWPTHTKQQTEDKIAARGLGGEVRGEENTVMAYGYEVADHLARKYANHNSDKMGRGFLFWDCVAALDRAATAMEQVEEKAEEVKSNVMPVVTTIPIHYPGNDDMCDCSGAC